MTVLKVLQHPKFLMVYGLQVDNRTFPCYYPGQELQIRLIAQGWLHVGSISCPSCEEICLVIYVFFV